MDHLFGANYDSLSQHIAALKAEGYDDVSLLRDATVGDLEELGIHRVHAEEIIQCAKPVISLHTLATPFCNWCRCALRCSA
jgi:predicted metal-dependent phosphoesterase TrpH